MGNEHDMRISKIKTKVMVCDRDEQIRTSLIVNNNIFEGTKESVYLGIRVTKDGKSKKLTE